MEKGAAMKEADVHAELLKSFRDKNIHARKIADMPFGGTGGGFNPEKPYDIFAFCLGGCGIEVKLMKKVGRFSRKKMEESQIKNLNHLVQSVEGLAFLFINVRTVRSPDPEAPKPRNDLYIFDWSVWGDVIVNEGIDRAVFEQTNTEPARGLIKIRGERKRFDLGAFLRHRW